LAEPSFHPDRTSLAVTLGDPRGIGPEVSHRATELLLAEAPDTSLLILTPPRLRALFSGVEGHVRFHPIEDWDGSEGGAGHLAVTALETAVRLALEGQVGAVVTAPVHKPSLHRAGWQVPGQTEMLQEMSGAETVGMLMCAEQTKLGGPLRVLLATTHLALRDVPDALTVETLVDQTLLLRRCLQEEWGLEEPRIALCALNPHASDDGLFGDEEARVFAPAVSLLERAGISVEGPLPADTVFGLALGGGYDAVVAPYHDVGMAAFKTAAFGTGVNVTLGLPFVRTSPDHGTAFALAETPGQADPSSMLEALRLARTLTRNRFDTESRDV
jgi:4-hydroxythreonine-4-phosphate dehydrogenase